MISINVTSSNPSQVTQLTSQLGKEFSSNDLGQLYYFLGIEVFHNKDGLFLTQSRYALDLLNRASMSDCKHVSTPLSTSHDFRNCDHTPLSPSTITSYRSLLGAL